MGGGSVLTEMKNVYGPLQSFRAEKKKNKENIILLFSFFMVSSYRND